MMLLKSNGILQMLVKFHAKYIKIEETVSENLKLTFVEEILGLNIILKILLDDHKLFGDFISSGGVELFLQIYEIGEAKKYLDEVILNTFAFALKEIQYCDFFEDALKKVI